MELSKKHFTYRWHQSIIQNSCLNPIGYTKRWSPRSSNDLPRGDYFYAVPSDLCTWIRPFFYYLLLNLPAFAVVATIALTCIGSLLTAGIFAVYDHHVFNDFITTIYDDWQIETLRVFMIASMVLGSIGAIVLGLFGAGFAISEGLDRFRSWNYHRIESKKNDPNYVPPAPRGPSLFSQWYKAHKDKYCVDIKLVD